MDHLTQKSVFDMTPEELTARLKPVTEKIVSTALNDGRYISYSAGNPDKPTQFIHENMLGERKLVEIDLATGKEQHLKNL